MKNIVNRLLRKGGYTLVRIHPRDENAKSFRLFEYRKEDGSFDYPKYRRIQQEGNLKKLDQVWVLEENIRYLSEYVQRHLDPLSFGICHGTRRGNEQKWFRQYVGCEVIGTEISASATQFPNTIQWDFHEENPEWTNRVDFIYSNSFDHSYDPEECLNIWIKSLRPGGFCILEHSNLHAPEGASQLDPFGAEIEIMPYLIAKWGKDQFYVRELLDAPTKGPNVKTLSFLVIQRAD